MIVRAMTSAQLHAGHDWRRGRSRRGRGQACGGTPWGCQR